MNFIKLPNLPEGDTALAAVSFAYPDILRALRALGMELIEIQPGRCLPGPVGSHADMLLHHLGGNQMVTARGEASLKDTLRQFDFEVIESNGCLSERYPDDVPLNAARVGNFLFCRQDSLDLEIGRYCSRHGVSVIPVRQGYARCSTVVVSESAIMTADSSIAQAAESADLDVLRIRPGHVRLEGYPYGFLGGACGMIGKNKLAFAGNVGLHPDYEAIKKFCGNRNVETISLADMPLTDIGGILPLKIADD
jgi:hypothetical protein